MILRQNINKAVSIGARKKRLTAVHDFGRICKMKAPSCCKAVVLFTVAAAEATHLCPYGKSYGKHAITKFVQHTAFKVIPRGLWVDIAEFYSSPFLDEKAKLLFWKVFSQVFAFMSLFSIKFNVSKFTVG